LIRTWRRLSAGEQDDVEAEVLALPLPGLSREIRVSWES
jgi:hypothetical protein